MVGWLVGWGVGGLGGIRKSLFFRPGGGGEEGWGGEGKREEKGGREGGEKKGGEKRGEDEGGGEQRR